MSRDVKIQVLDVVSASGPKTMFQNEPFVLRNSGAIRQVKNGTTNLTSTNIRVGLSTTTEGYTDDDDLLNSPTIIQLATVEDIQISFNKLKEFTDLNCGTTEDDA